MVVKEARKMPKISKNIKKFRAEKNLTQDALAEKIHVTRQAISNWENDKTKPDIEALEALATALDVEVEELIYGEKKEIIVSQDKTKEKNRIKIILAIVGSLFVASGLALVFFGFWQKFPVALQTVFAFVPILLGQGAAIFTLLKKKESVAWREGSAILWTVGLVATIALLNDIHNINLGYINCLTIDAFMVIPIMFLFNAVSPLAFVLYASIHIITYELLKYVIISTVIFIIAIIFTTIFVRNKDDSRGVYVQWITTLAGIILVWIYNVVGIDAGVLLNSFDGILLLYISAFLCMYILSSEKSPYSLPYKPLSLLGLFVTTGALSVAAFHENYSENELISMISGSAICLLLPIIGTIIRIKSFKENLSKILIVALPYGIMVITIIMTFIDTFADWKYDFISLLTGGMILVTRAVIATFGVALIYAGVKELRLFLVNLGLVTAFVQIINLVYSGIFELTYFSFGTILVIFGAVIIAINWKLLSVKKKLKEQAEGDNENA